MRLCLVAVDLALVGASNLKAKVLSLDGGELSQLGVDVVQVAASDLLIQLLGQNVDTDVLLAASTELNVLLAESGILGLEESDLSKDLVGEGAGHDEGRVTGGTAQVDQATLSQEDNVLAVQEVAVDLGLDVLDGLSVGLQPGNVNLNIEVTNVANNGVVAHGLEVTANQDVTATSGGDEDLTDLSGLLHGGDLVTLDGGLESVDGVDLSNEDTSTHGVQGLGATLTNITVTGNDTDLTGDHDIGSTLDTVNEGLTATVQVVELGLGDTVVDVDGGDLELALLQHAVQVVDTSGGLLGDTVAVIKHLGVLRVDEGGQVTTVIEDKVELLVILESEQLLLKAPLVLLLGLTLPGEDRDTGGSNGGGSVVLGGENVAGSPGDLSTKGSEGLNEDSSLNGHVQTTSDTGTGEGLVLTVLLTDGHETGHLNLGELNLPATESGQGDISNLELLSGGRHDEL